MNPNEFLNRGEWKDGWFVVPYQVVFRDLDYFGHVNNAVFFTYFEWARTLLWFELLGGAASPRDISFIVARAECDFKAQIELEPIEIAVRISEMRNTSLDFVYELRKSRGEQIAATGRVVVVLFDWNSQSKVAIGDDLRRKVEACRLHAF
ncbi:MAG TPA: thioesterase family protein [Thermoanaerobaculia bacterium]|nr:thioesterase family protein [Thermoanaerobaculia bacterium]